VALTRAMALMALLAQTATLPGARSINAR
jgi:hypothetical protein